MCLFQGLEEGGRRTIIELDQGAATGKGGCVE